MYQYWDWLKHPTVLALIGATPGALRGLTHVKKLGFLRALSDVMIGFISAASAADWFTPKDRPMAALLIGMVAGMVGARSLDALYALAPTFMRELALGWARKVTAAPSAPYYPEPTPQTLEYKDLPTEIGDHRHDPVDTGETGKLP